MQFPTAALLLCGGALLISTSTTTMASPINEAQKIERPSPVPRSLLPEIDARRICETPDCVIRSANLLQDTDRSVDPCVDFYEYACGNYVKRTRIPDEKSSMSKFSIISDQLTEQLRDTLESGINDKDIRPYRMVKKYYNACMNSSHVEETSENEVKATLKGFGGWPVLEGDKWDESTFDWDETGMKHLKNGLSNDNFVGCDIGIDSKNNSIRTIEFDQASLGLSQKYLAKGLDNKIVKAYYDFMVDMAVMLGADRKLAESELKESLEFEMALANISLPMEERRDSEKLYNPIRFGDVKKRYPSYDWQDYANRMIMGYAKVADDEIINVAVPKFLDDVIKLIAKTPKRVQANYAHWRVAYQMVSAMGEKYRDRLIQFNKHLTGQTTKVPRWKKCVSEATGNFHLAVSSLYVRRFFDESAKKNAVELIEGIRDSFRNILNKIDWMDDKTRAKALDKLEHVVPHVAFPDELVQDDKLEDYYQKLEFKDSSFLLNRLEISKFFIDKSFAKFRQPVNKTDWRTHGNAAVVNAFYMPGQNSMMFPAGILQGNFFGKDRPAYMNFGSIGWVMGHEITHGFDDQGRQFDMDGNLVEWWAEETKKRYLERAQCIIDQYGNYTVKEAGLNINGINTQGENIADNGGIKEAYYAYEAYERTHGPEPALPGFSNYTSRQLFWLSAANVWCNVQRPEALKSQINTGVHSPSRFRVIGTFSNQREFSKDYNCPLGSPMNPEKKCAVW